MWATMADVCTTGRHRSGTPWGPRTTIIATRRAGHDMFSGAPAHTNARAHSPYDASADAHISHDAGARRRRRAGYSYDPFAHSGAAGVADKCNRLHDGDYPALAHETT